MDIFISWSGNRGRYLADCLVKILDEVNHNLKPWVSDRLAAGKEWLAELNDKLAVCDVGLVIITPESRKSEWLHYEAGSLKKADAHKLIIPLCFELGLDEVTDPMSQLQSRIFDESNLLDVCKQLNRLLPEDARRDELLIIQKFQRIWKEHFLEALPGLSNVRLSYDDSFRELLDSLSTNGCGEVKFASTYQFDTGFEDWQLYESVFRHAKERVWVLGRKNRKAFDKSFKWFFEDVANENTFKKDVRFMFLSPSAPMEIIQSAHQDEDFQDQLASSIKQAKSRLDMMNLSVDSYFRFYSAIRNYHIIVCDESVLYAPVKLDLDGKAESLTRAPFQVIDASSEYGKELVEQVGTIWTNGKRFSEVIE